MRKRSWTMEQLVVAARNAKSYRSLLIALGLRPAGGNYLQIQKYITELAIEMPNLQKSSWNKGLRFNRPKRDLALILIKDSDFQSFKLKKRLFAESLKFPQCEECGWAKQSPDGRIPLELDHINGDHRDNRLENLRVLCPNCHSLKPTHRGANRRKNK